MKYLFLGVAVLYVIGLAVAGGVEAKQNITVTWAPTGYPTFYSNASNGDNYYRTITMNVITGDKSHAVFKINEDDGQVWAPEDKAHVHTLRFPAGVGRHIVEVWVLYEDGTKKYVKRTFKVLRAPVKARDE